jgi:hypothetical protein
MPPQGISRCASRRAPANCRFCSSSARGALGLLPWRRSRITSSCRGHRVCRGMAHHPGTATVSRNRITPTSSGSTSLGPAAEAAEAARMKEPPRRPGTEQAHGAGREAAAAKRQAKLEDPLAHLNIPANSLADAQQSLPGPLKRCRCLGLSLIGQRGWFGHRTGAGIGPGQVRSGPGSRWHRRRTIRSATA